MIRKPAVAGQFYPGSEQSLKEELERCLDLNLPKKDAFAVVSPHAGYIYSGKVAGAVYSCVNLPKTFVILSPNHTGAGAEGAIMTETGWETPLGVAPINKKLALNILEKSSHLTEDPLAHFHEHSLEVQLPFIQYLVPDLTFVPICLGFNQLSIIKELGSAIAQAIKEYDEKVLLISSTDMTHFENQSSAERKDRMAIDKIIALDTDGLYETVIGNNITMCGIAPTVAVIQAAKQLGAREAELIKYSTSGMVSRDFSSVVGYAGLVIR
jgi:AmmeMemoRadiSam system protein B